MTLKFRAWDKKAKKMYPVDGLNLNPELKEPYVIVPQGERKFKTLPLSAVEVMQSLGLKDKYGREIFEGDILTDEGFFENDGRDYATIEFDKSDYYYWINWIYEDFGEPVTGCEKYAVAGNIYEDEELLQNL